MRRRARKNCRLASVDTVNITVYILRAKAGSIDFGIDSKCTGEERQLGEPGDINANVFSRFLF